MRDKGGPFSVFSLPERDRRDNIGMRPVASHSFAVKTSFPLTALIFQLNQSDELQYP